MAYVYLIGQNGDSDYYKIGSTRASDLNKRIKQLQTGNSNQLYLKHSFQTDTPFKLERMLHFYYNKFLLRKNRENINFLLILNIIISNCFNNILFIDFI